VKRIAFVAIALAVTAAACGGDKPTLRPPSSTSTSGAAFGATPTSTPSAARAKTPADSDSPAAGTCATTTTGYAVIELNADVPSPRCTIVHAGDRLRIHNATQSSQTIDTGFTSATLQPGELLTLGEQLGDVWEPGVHRINTGDLYAGSGPEVWLK
jgi:hypothetical protein